MRTALKLIAFLVVLAIAAVVAIPFVIDPNDYKDEISQQVEKATGRSLTLQGDIGLSVFPWIALELGPMSLSNAEGFKAESFAQVQAAEIRIKLLPLLKKQLEMDTIVLDGLVLNLETDKEGKTNWEDLAKSDAEQAPEETPPAAEPEQKKPGLSAINIAGVKLTNANILWSDASKGENFQLRNLNLNTDPLLPNQPVAVDMAFDLISTKPEAKAHVTLATNAVVDMANQQYTFNDLKFNTIAAGKALPVAQADISLTGNVSADLTKQLVSIPNLVLNAKTNKDQQTVDAKLTANVSSNLETQQTTLTNLDVTASVNDPAIANGPADIKLTSNVLADMKQQTVTISALALQLKDLMLEADVKASKILSDKPTFAGSAQVKPFNLRKLATDLKIDLPEMADKTTLENVALQSEFEGTPTSINAKRLAVTLDQSNLTGQLGITNFAKPAFNFGLKLDQIDADRYLPPVKEESKETPAAEKPKAADKAATPGAAAAQGAEALPLDTLRQINANGTIDIGKLKITGLTGENIHATINAKDGLVKLTPMRADIYQGKYNGNVILDAREESLKLSIDESVKGVKAGPLIKDMTGDSKLSGTASANIKMTGNGKTVAAIKKTLNGNGNFSFTDGAVEGINLAQLIRRAQAAMKGQQLPASKEPEKTDFSELSGSFTVKNGVVDNQDLDIKSPLLRITGAGKVSLPEETIDYGLKVSVVESISGQGGAELAELKGLTIPVKITGTFSNPKPSVDLANLVKDKAKEKLKEKAEEKLKEKLGDDIGGLLGGALGGKKPATNKAAPAEGDAAVPAEETQGEEAPSGKQQLEDAVKDKLKSFF